MTTTTTRRRADPTRDSAIAEAYRAGARTAEIRRQFGLNSDAVLYAALHRMGVQLRGRGRPAQNTPPPPPPLPDGRTYRLTGEIIVRAGSAQLAIEAAGLDQVHSLERINS